MHTLNSIPGNYWCPLKRREVLEAILIFCRVGQLKLRLVIRVFGMQLWKESECDFLSINGIRASRINYVYKSDTIFIPCMPYKLEHQLCMINPTTTGWLCMKYTGTNECEAPRASCHKTQGFLMLYVFYIMTTPYRPCTKSHTILEGTVYDFYYTPVYNNHGRKLSIIISHHWLVWHSGGTVRSPVESLC